MKCQHCNMIFGDQSRTINTDCPACPACVECGPEEWKDISDIQDGFEFSSQGRLREKGKPSCRIVQRGESDGCAYYRIDRGSNNSAYRGRKLVLKTLFARYWPDRNMVVDRALYEQLRQRARSQEHRPKTRYESTKEGPYVVNRCVDCGRPAPGVRRCEKCKAAFLKKHGYSSVESVHDFGGYDGECGRRVA